MEGETATSVLLLGVVGTLHNQDSSPYLGVGQVTYQGLGVGQSAFQGVEAGQAAFQEVGVGQAALRGVGTAEVWSGHTLQRVVAVESLSLLLWWWRWEQLELLQRVYFSSSRSR